MIFWMLLQATTPPPTPPDIQLDARVTAREVRIERKGEARLTLHAGPDGGTDIEVAAPPGEDRTRLRNVEVRVHAEARIAAPATNSRDTETPPPN